MFDTVVPDKMPSYSAHLPETYFNYQQSPLIRIKIPEGIEYFYRDLISTDVDELKRFFSDMNNFSVTNITITGNFFDTVATVQPFISSQSFKGNIMHVESESIFARVRFISNLIDDAVSWGGDVSQVYVEGAAFSAISNSIQRCGKLDLQYYNYT